MQLSGTRVLVWSRVVYLCRSAAAGFVLGVVFCCSPASAQSPATDVTPGMGIAQAQTATGRNGMVATQEALATRVGVDILSRGGNAVDAAVAVGFALAVTLPKAGNLGGGGFMVIHLANGNKDVAIDYRESAPSAIRRDSFLNDKGEADPQKSRNSALAVGVPGSVAGLALAHRDYGSGKFSLAELIAPAIALARSGRAGRKRFARTRCCCPGRGWPAGPPRQKYF